MILIDNILVSEEILTTKFSCNLQECKGACCTFPGEYGAPVLDKEKDIIEENLEATFEYLSGKSIEFIRKYGFVEGKKGNLSTVCIDKKDCVFVYYEEDIAKCAIEKAYFAGKIKFRKPLSCHLFPVRVSDFGGDYLYYAEFPECNSALKYGEEKNTFIFDTVKEALVRAYGNDWYNLLIDYAQTLNQNK
jgi:hypothetical protein